MNKKVLCLGIVIAFTLSQMTTPVRLRKNIVTMLHTESAV